MPIAEVMDTGFAHTAALALSFALGWFLSSGNPILTVTVGSILKMLYTDLVTWANDLAPRHLSQVPLLGALWLSILVIDDRAANRFDLRPKPIREIPDPVLILAFRWSAINQVFHLSQLFRGKFVLIIVLDAPHLE
jgi:hypothetical protein